MELQKQKPRNNADEHLLNDIVRLETEETVAKDDLSFTLNGLKDVREKLRHARKQVEDLTTKVNKARDVICHLSHRSI